MFNSLSGISRSTAYRITGLWVWTSEVESPVCFLWPEAPNSLFVNWETRKGVGVRPLPTWPSAWPVCPFWATEERYSLSLEGSLKYFFITFIVISYLVWRLFLTRHYHIKSWRIQTIWLYSKGNHGPRRLRSWRDPTEGFRMKGKKIRVNLCPT